MRPGRALPFAVVSLLCRQVSRPYDRDVDDTQADDTHDTDVDGAFGFPAASAGDGLVAGSDGALHLPGALGEVLLELRPRPAHAHGGRVRRLPSQMCAGRCRRIQPASSSV
jgi:hypothetical protein